MTAKLNFVRMNFWLDAKKKLKKLENFNCSEKLKEEFSKILEELKN